MDRSASIAGADDTALWFRAPAAVWEEALPLGTGRLGAMAFGGVGGELFQLNDDRLWSGGPAAAVPGDPAVVGRARQRVLAGDAVGAEELLKTVQGPDTARYLPLADLRLELRIGDGEVGEYERRLDLATGVYAVRYRVGAVEVVREAVCHPGLHVLAWRVRVDRPAGVEVEVRLGNALGAREFVDGRVVGIAGVAPVDSAVPADSAVQARPAAPTDFAAGPAGLAGVAGSADAAEAAGAAGAEAVGATGPRRIAGMAYAAAVLVHREDPHTVTLYVATEAGYRGPASEPERDPAVCARLATDRAEQARARGWSRLRHEAVAAHREPFDRVTIDLGPAPDLPTDERVAAPDPALAALLFRFGRYLLITSSRPGTLPANLQGVWNPHVDPPWRGNYTLNINLQMNYWPAEVAGLPECHQPLLEFVERLAAQGVHVARELYGAPGWAAHHNSDPWCLATPVGAGTGDPAWANWPMGGAWLALHLWEHFEFGGDQGWLRDRAWPVLRGAAEFCAAWLADHDGVLTTAPSTSPENHYLDSAGRPVAVGVGSTMDLTLIAELFARLVAAAEVLEAEDEVVAGAKELLPRLPSPPVGSRGQLLEWAEELPDAEPGHRHVSHLVGLYPGSRIDVHRTPRLAAAAKQALRDRGDAGTGWSLAWKTALWARLGDGERAGELLALFLTDVMAKSGGGVYRNLFCAHPPFQVDGNFGITAAIAEMLLQSHADELRVLPALPPSWRRGEVRGLRARGGLTVDIAWDEGELAELRVRGDEARTVAVRYRDRLFHQQVVRPPRRRAR